MSCEKCWEDAYLRGRYTAGGQPEEYRKLLEERKDNPCSEMEQKYGNRWRERLAEETALTPSPVEEEKR